MNKELASNIATTGLGLINTDMSVGMDSLVDIFVSKYEDSLHDQRKAIQVSMVIATKQITDLVDHVKEGLITLIKKSLPEPQTTCMMSVRLELTNSNSFDWTNGLFNYSVQSYITFLQQSGTKRDKENYSTYSSSISIPTNDMEQYKIFVDNKQVLLDQLNEINTKLRDIDRQTRKIRATIAEKKLTELGMVDLLKDNDLIKLISFEPEAIEPK